MGVFMVPQCCGEDGGNWSACIGRIIFYQLRQEAVNLINASYFQMSFNGLGLDLKFHFSLFAN